MRADGRVLLGLALALAGCSDPGDASVTSSTSDTRPTHVRIEEFARVYVDGVEADLQIAAPGRYTIYYEFKSEVEGATVTAAADPPADLQLTVLDHEGEELRLRTSRDVTEYEYEPFAGVSLGTVEFPAPGDYVIRATGGDEPFVIAIGRGILD